ncbi:MAG: hypothetical protein H7Y22_06550 [Gemmatimonadaceae bacterium]|nr:hypothetical protein [Gloeobacterales cyanobacterium ES-bin-141]
MSDHAVFEAAVRFFAAAPWTRFLPAETIDLTIEGNRYACRVLQLGFCLRDSSGAVMSCQFLDRRLVSPADRQRLKPYPHPNSRTWTVFGGSAINPSIFTAALDTFATLVPPRQSELSRTVKLGSGQLVHWPGRLHWAVRDSDILRQELLQFAETHFVEQIRRATFETTLGWKKLAEPPRRIQALGLDYALFEWHMMASQTTIAEEFQNQGLGTTSLDPTTSHFGLFQVETVLDGNQVLVLPVLSRTLARPLVIEDGRFPSQVHPGEVHALRLFYRENWTLLEEDFCWQPDAAAQLLRVATQLPAHLLKDFNPVKLSELLSFIALTERE